MPHRTPATQMVSSIPCQSSDLESRGFVTDPTPVRHRSPKECRAAPLLPARSPFQWPTTPAPALAPFQQVAASLESHNLTTYPESSIQLTPKRRGQNGSHAPFFNQAF